MSKGKLLLGGLVGYVLYKKYWKKEEVQDVKDAAVETAEKTCPFDYKKMIDDAAETIKSVIGK